MNRQPPSFGIARTLRRAQAGEAANDLNYWRQCSMVERIDAALDIRNEHHGSDHEAEQRLERILARVECR